MNDLQIFSNPEFGQVRTVEIDGQPWLVGKDVAVALGYKNPRDAITRHVDTEDKDVVKHDTPASVCQITLTFNKRKWGHSCRWGNNGRIVARTWSSSNSIGPVFSDSWQQT